MGFARALKSGPTLPVGVVGTSTSRVESLLAAAGKG